MAKRNETKVKKKPIEQYEHKAKKRVNNPPVGLVDAKSDATEGKKIYAYDPHLDPTLVWAGKAERTSFEVPTVSLHVHERIDPRAIIEAVRKKNGSNYEQLSLFGSKEENPPLREAIEFYKHSHDWSNRFIAGDSLLVMNSLLEKEGMAGQVQMIYFDPPYGITYGSNFQPFVNNREVKDRKDADLTAEPETIKAFRDAWELGLHSYLTFLRDRLFVARDLLHESGSVFVQISDENVHHVREILQEVFEPKNFVVTIALKKKGNQKSGMLSPVNDYILWATKNITAARNKFHPLFKEISPDELVDTYNLVELSDGTEISIAELIKQKGIDYRRFPKKFIEDFPNAKFFESKDLTAGGYRRTQSLKYTYRGVEYDPGLAKGNCWKHSVITDDGSVSGMDRLAKSNRLFVGENQLRVKRYSTDFPYVMVTNWWDEFGGATDRVYVVQTNPSVIERCILMTTDPGDLVLDITCGSGTTAFVAEQWGRRWITCDTSRVALTLAKQRLMTAVFDYFQLARPDEGVDSGLRYKTVPHITSTSIANDEPPESETLYEQPLVDTTKMRVTGPFTVEAVPAPMVKSPDELSEGETRVSMPADESVARSGATVRQDEWRSELLRTGIRGKAKQMIHFSRVEPFSGTRWLHADAETKGDKPQRAVISFGPEHAPLEQKQVEMALEEARKLVPRPQLIVFAAFQFDPEAAKDIDELNWPGVTTLKAQMNADLLTEDLKKKRTSNESFWLVGQPDVRVKKVKTDLKGQGRLDVAAGQEHLTSYRYQVEVYGFDYYNTKTGQIESGGSDKIALWMLDTDYDGRSLFPRQVFFPMAGEKEGWSKLAKNLRSEIDEEQIEKYRGSVSLPFAAGEHGRIAVKIVDDRGIESLKIVSLT